MIDLHSHVLHGVDDGATSLSDAVAIARAASEAGTLVLAATPHVRDDYPTTPALIEDRLHELRSAIAVEGLPIQIVQGAEIALDRLALIHDDDLCRMSIAGAGRHVLVETPYYGWPADMGQAFFRLGLRGYVPILAHPERNAAVQDNYELLRPLVGQGALIQLTASSLDGRLGRRPARVGRDLVDAGLAHLVASDAHAPTGRGVDLIAACRTLGDPDLAMWLCHDVGTSILDGVAVPPRPGRIRRRLFWR